MLLHGCFSRFLNFINGAKSRNAPHIVKSHYYKSAIAYNRYVDEKEEPTLGKYRVAEMKILLKGTLMQI